MPSIGPLEILVVLVVAILVLPPDKLPEAARQVGKTIAAFRRFQSTLTKDFESLVSSVEPERDPTPTLPPKEPEAPKDPEAPTEPEVDADAVGESATDRVGSNGSGPDGPGTETDVGLQERAERDDG